MVPQYKCLECNKWISEKNYAISRHVKEHNLQFKEYIMKFYNLVGGKLEKCGFCDDIADPQLLIDHNTKTYSIEYKKGYFCNTQECKNSISLDILGEDYDPKKFEKIGSRSDYLSRRYKIEISDAKEMKHGKEISNYFNNSKESFIEKYGDVDGVIRYDKRIEGISKNSARNKFPCTLDNFIRRYGEDLGTKKYKDRCDRISYTSSRDFFIEKYGEEKGSDVWKNKFKRLKTSKKSNELSILLDKLSINYIKEKNILSKFVDYFLYEYNIVIEYFGDYWHCNPKKYGSEFYTRQLKMTAKEIWKKDRERLEVIKQKVNSIIIIWESSEINDTLLEKVINDVRNKKTIIYI